MIADLRQLWQEAFGDSDAFLDSFFATGFSPDRCHYLTENGELVSALYWFDCCLHGHKLAYLYAVATKKEWRGRGLAARLMTETHEILKKRGYAGAMLVPGTAELFHYYEKMGYRTATQVEEFSAVAAEESCFVRQITPEEYAALRRKYLPGDGVVQENATLSYLATYANFYQGEDFLLLASGQVGNLLAHELLGNTAAAGGILRALGLAEGRFRTPGTGRDFSMFLPLQEDCPTPGYFGLALD